jgi:hypothetical protein
MGDLPAIDAGAGEVVLQFAGRLGDRLGRILARLVDVAEIDELPDRLLGVDGIDLRVWRVAAVFAGDGIPGVEVFDLGRGLVDRQQRPAIHVAPHREPEEGEKGGGDVEEGGAEDELVFFDPRPTGDEDPVIAVLGRRACRLVRHALRAKMVGVKAVVADEDHGRLGAGELQKSAKHEIVIAVRRVDDVFVKLEVALAHPLESRWVILHEAMAEVVDGVEVDGRKIPVGDFLKQMHRPPVDPGAFGDQLGERAEPLVFLLIDLRGLGDEVPEEIAIELMGMEALVGEIGGELRRVDGACSQRPGLAERGDRLLEVVGHHRAADRLGGGTRPPADDKRGVAGLVEDVPDGLRFAGEIRDRPDAARMGIGLGEAVDPVLEGALSGGDARPEHWRERGLERGEISHHAVLHQPADMGHEPHVDQG